MVEGQQYPIHCRVAASIEEPDPPATADGTPLPGEEILLDDNVLAEGHDFFSLGAREGVSAGPPRTGWRGAARDAIRSPLRGAGPTRTSPPA